MDLLTIITVLIIISAAISYLNVRFLKLPRAIGIVFISIMISLLILVGGKTGSGIAATITALANNIDFSKVLLDVMLAFLLFASALHFDYKKLRAQRLPVFLLSTLGVLISTAFFAGLFYLITQLLRIPIPLTYCFLFGALISPTDPIAVGALLQKSKVPIRLQTIISGESLFNDGVGLILFVTFLNIANASGPGFSWGATLELFAQEVLGGISMGLVAGYAGYRLIRSINEYQTILLISIALVLGISVIAHQIHVSIPLAAVAAGLVVGNEHFNMDYPANHFLIQIWQLLDQVLNTILFVMIGLQLVIMPFLSHYWLIGLLSVIVILLARLASIILPAIFLLRKVNPANLAVLTWAGVRGGISVAMALSLPVSPYREIILSSCYFIVIFSIIIQGLTLNRLVEKLFMKPIPNGR